jgi:flagellar protein FlgJ
MKTIDFVKKYLKPALDSEFETGIPHDFLLAQAAIETGWGKNSIGNNIFGITATKNWKGKTQKVWTTEYLDKPTAVFEGVTYNGTPYYSPTYKKTRYKYKVQRSFRDYDNIKDCFNDHFKVLSLSRYKKAFEYKNDSCKFALEIAAAGYATGENYGQLLCDVIKMINRIIIDNKLMAICKG